jgi:tryptophanyl-tRNA synthetase
MKKIFSGIQPSGILHLGNYLGAIKQWVELQKTHQCIYCIVDLHAITVPQDPKQLKANIYRAAATYLAAGVDPEKSTIFIQSHRPEHVELMWYLNTITRFGEMRRMTQFKDKKAKFNEEEIPLGIFNYPVLMAADILLYDTDLVPVGGDQKQHVELTRNLAQRFNNKFGDTFKMPEPLIKKETAFIMGLDNPKLKMSKSASSVNNFIALTDSADVIRRKITRAVTDSGREIKAGEDKPALTNLLTIYSQLTDKSMSEVEKLYIGKTYAQFKQDLAEVVVDAMTPIGQRIAKLEKDQKLLESIISQGAEKLAPLALNTIMRVRKRIGLV